MCDVIPRRVYNHDDSFDENLDNAISVRLELLAFLSLRRWSDRVEKELIFWLILHIDNLLVNLMI